MKRINQSGQMVVEMILILTLLFGFTVFVAAQFRQQEYFKAIVSGPWLKLAGMMQNGVWDTPEKSKDLHPNYRGSSWDPKSSR